MAPFERTNPSSPARGGLAGFGVAAFAIVCCGAFSLLVALASGVAVGTILGVGAAVAVAAALVGILIWRLRRAKRCAPTGPLSAYDRRRNGLTDRQKVVP